MRIAIEAGTHSPWASRVLEECGHEVLVADVRKLRLNYARANAKQMRSMPLESGSRLQEEWTRSCSIHSSTGVRTPRLIWPQAARVRRWSVVLHRAGQPRPRSGQILRR